MKIKKIWVMTMFKEYFNPFLEYGVIAKALKNERSEELKFEFNVVSIPDNCKRGFKGVDDSPYGGGAGMVMRADALKEALINGVVNPGNYKLDKIKEQLHIVYPAPRGKTWDAKYAEEFAKNLDLTSDKDIVFICGRYEGADERFLENYVDEYISLGNFILTGGELAVMTVLDSSLRFVSGVLGNKLSAEDESFKNDLLEYPLYTRPMEFEGKRPPEVLLGGNHAHIEDQKEQEKLRMTKKFRDDLFK